MPTLSAFIIVVLYFLPTIQALTAKKKNAASIAIINVFLSWTFIGWVVAMAWAVKKD